MSAISVESLTDAPSISGWSLSGGGARRAHATSTGAGGNHWRQDAACAELPTVESDRIFYPNNASYAEARVWCAGCPVRAACLDDAFVTEAPVAPDEWFGFRGGFTPAQRREYMRGAVA